MRRDRAALMIGLGTISRTHLAVLNRRDDVAVVAGVDPAPGSDHPFPAFTELDDALAAHPAPDLVVVATPTDTHVDLVDELLRRTDALVLSEKPLARTSRAVQRLRDRHSPEVLERRVKVAHHFAFSPEVEWARSLVQRHPEWGPPTSILAVFNDAYAGLPAGQLEGYVSSWVDSGPNQLSIVASFVPDWRLASHARRTERAVTVLDHPGGQTVLTSNWLAADTSKQTSIEYRGGEVLVRMDHTSMTGLVIDRTGDGTTAEHVAYTGTASRKEAHYLGLYGALLTDPGDERLGVGLATRIAASLEEADTHDVATSLAWSSVAAEE